MAGIGISSAAVGSIVSQTALDYAWQRVRSLHRSACESLLRGPPRDR